MQDVTFHFLLKSGNRRIVIDRQILAHVIRRSEACEMTRMFSDGQRLGSRKFGSDSGFFSREASFRACHRCFSSCHVVMMFWFVAYNIFCRSTCMITRGIFSRHRSGVVPNTPKWAVQCCSDPFARGALLRICERKACHKQNFYFLNAPPRSGERFIACIFFHFYGFREIAYPRLILLLVSRQSKSQLLVIRLSGNKQQNQKQSSELFFYHRV